MITLKDLEKDPLIKEYLAYDPKKDSNGAYGIGLAERICKKYGSIENIKPFLKLLKGKKEFSDENKEVNKLESTISEF